MRKSWFSWWIATFFWIILFVIGTAIIWIRKVDGAGAVQTPELKLVAFIVLLISFIIPLIIQAVWLIIKWRNSNKN